MAQTVTVNLGERSYDINIGTGLAVGRCLADHPAECGLLVSDSNVFPLYGDLCLRRLAEAGVAAEPVIVPAGEQSKSLDMAARIYAGAVATGLDRGSVIVALGGGMVGDLAGFAAATYMRGIRLIQAPTSLLAMVDSSVGGKTAVNLPEGKNLVGVFHQPVEVAADLATLATLPPREYVSGLAEVVKYGVIWDAALFKDLEDSAEALAARDAETLERVVTRCCEIKADIVAMDEREAGVRAILNFGHTGGHALEQVSGYDRWLHGEAVALGMVYAARLSVAERGLDADEAARIESLLQRVGLPVRWPAGEAPPAWADLRQAMQADKKTRGRTPRFVLAEQLGAVVFGCEAPDSVLEEAWGGVVRREM